MDQPAARLVILKAPGRFDRLEVTDTIEAHALKDSADGSGRQTQMQSDPLANPALPAQGPDLLTNRLGRRPVKLVQSWRAIP